MAGRRVLPTVSIVGSAGRRGDAAKMNKKLYLRMVEKAKAVITKDFKLDFQNIHLVSGGAAWSDHVAVGLFLLEDVQSLTLHFPSEWVSPGTVMAAAPQFHDNGSEDQRKNPGRAANKLHRKFSESIGEDTLQQLQDAQTLGAEVCIHEGFHKRNTLVANSDYLLAFTWGEDGQPKKGGGTHSTWEKCHGQKLHVPLSSLLPTDHSVAAQGKGRQPLAGSKRKRENSIVELFKSRETQPVKKPDLHHLTEDK